jgi:hypothetical protein
MKSSLRDLSFLLFKSLLLLRLSHNGHATDIDF